MIKFVFGLFLWCGLYGCNSSCPTISLRMDKQVAPVFIRQEENSVVHIQVDNTTDKELVLNKLVLSAKGTSRIEAVKQVRIYFTGLNPNFSSTVLFGHTQNAREVNTFKGQQALKPGINHFWVSVCLSENALLSDKIHFTCTDATLSDACVVVADSLPLLSSAVGYAVRLRGDDQVNAYRIPGLVCTPKGTLIAVYDVRYNSAVDLQENIDVGVSRSVDGGQTWLPMQIAMDMGEWGGRSHKENGIGDPAILVDPQTGRVWIAGLWLHGNPGKRAWWASKPGITPEETGQFVLAYSDDDGATWSEPINITSQVKKKEWYLCFQGPGMGITTQDGTLVFPAQFKDKNQVPYSTIIYSKDKGKTWDIGTGARSNTTEAQVVELTDGSLMLNMRDDRGGSRAVMITKDFGKTWTEHVSSRSALPEPVCQASLIRIHLKGGKPALAFFNPANTQGRVHSTLKISLDEGVTWPEKYHTLVYEPGSYGYSCLTQIDSTTLGVLYEGAGELYFQRLNIGE